MSTVVFTKIGAFNGDFILKDCLSGDKVKTSAQVSEKLPDLILGRQVFILAR